MRDLSREARWSDVAAAADLGPLSPLEAVRPVQPTVLDPRREPADGVLDCLFTPAWTRRSRMEPDDLVVALARRGGRPGPGGVALSCRWRDRTWSTEPGRWREPVAGQDAFGAGARLHELRPEVRDFVLGEWAPDWMPDFLEWRRVRPPSRSPFG